MLPPVSQSELLQNEGVTWVELKGTLQVARRFFPMALTSIDHACVSEHIGIVRQRLSGNSQFAASTLVVAKPKVVVIGQRKVDFASIRLDAHSAIQDGLGEIKTGRCMIMAPEVCNAMHSGQQTPSLQKVRIPHESFIQQLGCLRQLFPCMDSIGCI